MSCRALHLLQSVTAQSSEVAGLDKTSIEFQVISLIINNKDINVKI